jgi:DNA mismatch repair protein MutL
MTKIHLLDSRTIDRIAAGEVVERPASAVKELVENALDAGASQIEVEIVGGGIEAIRVRDDGCGMSREDARLSVQRHATSKIRSEEDLSRIASFGFRGEALPSIASVSRLTLTTSDGGSPEATRLVVDGGAEPKLSPAARARGTDVWVESLFGRTPARRKFLKSPQAEAREVARVVTRAALANPSVAFRLCSDQKELLSAPAATDRAARITQVFGKDAVGELLAFEARSQEFSLFGLATRGSLTFATRRMQFFYVNGRPVEDRGIARAVQEAARESIRTARHPGAFLYLTAPEGTVDVNVSPSKTQVRFSRPAEIYRLVFHGLLSALSAGKEERRLAPVPTRDFSVAEAGEVYAAPPETPPGASAAAGRGKTLRLEVDSPGESSKIVEVPLSKPAPVRGIGQYDDSYILAEGETGLLVIDQHAAHERVLYEKMKERVAGNRAFSQALLTPEAIDASPEEAETLAESLPVLESLGFDLEPLSGRTWSIAAVPAEMSGRHAGDALRDILEALAGGSHDLERRKDLITAAVACRSAITIHYRLSPEEMSRLLTDWIRCGDRFTCPHGRPVVLSLSDADLLTFFKRR